MPTLGEAKVKISANLSQLKKDLAKAKSLVQSALKTVMPVAGFVGGVLGGVGSLVTGTIKTIVGGIKSLVFGAVDLVIKAVKTMVTVIKAAVTIVVRAFRAIARAAVKMAKIVTVALIGIGVVSAKLAADAEEVDNLFDVSFGNMAKAVRKWSNELSTALGLNSFQVRKFAAVFVAVFKGLGFAGEQATMMSKKLTELAFDISSFFNLPIEEAFLKLQSGITGEIEPLRRLGIIVNEVAVKQDALTRGIITEGQELTELQKVTSRLNIIMKQSKLAQGDLARTIDSTVNVFRTIKNVVTELAITLGEALNPVITRVAILLRDFLKSNRSDFAKWAKEVGEVFGFLVGNIEQKLSDNKDRVADWWNVVKDRFADFRESLPSMKQKVIDTFSSFRDWLDETKQKAEQWKDRLMPVFNAVAKVIDDFRATVKEFGLVPVLESMANVIGVKVMEGIRLAITAIAEFLSENKEVFEAGVSIGKALAKGLTQGFSEQFPELTAKFARVSAASKIVGGVNQINPFSPTSVQSPGRVMNILEEIAENTSKFKAGEF